ncbi:MAG: PIN domain-containing protein [Leptolyngbya sp. Prado105]|jgi:hypothetical protein|nr:PIN domain-containing protein [Leptolyngbya sp. Prado105]
MGTILLVDYENVQNIDLSQIQVQGLQIKIFVGQSQSKLPLELVQSIQRFGDAVEWIKIEGHGNNSLDFHIAFYLGQLSQAKSNLSFTVLSKDKGYDPLIRYLCNRKISCRRIESLKALSNALSNSEKGNQPLATSKRETKKQQTTLMEEVVIKLSKIQKPRRPQSRKALSQHIKSLLQPKKLAPQELDQVVNHLFVQKKIAEENNRIIYNF